MFVDEIKINVYGGHGGHGIVAFRREKYVEFGGPWGGDGGKGGSVILVGDPGMHSLAPFRYKRHIKAHSGSNGGSKGMTGANAENTYVKVPLGTIIHSEDGKYIGEITYPEQELVVASGGKGGRGNMRFATNKNPAPNICENGEPGVCLKIKLELKVLADVGLVGFPSVGKSTIISVISNARPKIADYPFTTIAPNLGVVRHHDEELVIADLPGLIENASLGMGLGFQFLRHIKRCRVIVHIIDLNREDPYEDYLKINKELNDFDETLLKRPVLIVFNKSDLYLEDELNIKINDLVKKINCAENYCVISAYSNIGIENLLDKIFKLYKDAPDFSKEEIEVKKHTLYEFIDKDADKNFDIEYINGLYLVTGPIIEKYYVRTDFSREENVLRFSRQLRSLGVDDKLKEMGAKTGATVKVIEFEFEYLDE